MPVTRTTMERLRSSALLGALVLACGGSSTGAADTSGTTGGSPDTASSSTSSSGGPSCPPGTEGCACDEGVCEGELSCLSEVCVMLPVAGSSSSGAVDSSTSSTSSTTTVAETSGASEDSTGSDGGSSSTGAGVVPCEQEGNHVCHDGVLDTCTDGEVISQTCDASCGVNGYLSSGCADGNGCACDGYVNEECAQIMEDYCNCNFLMYGSACDPSFQMQVYAYCYDPTIDPYSYDLLQCIAQHPNDTAEDCNAALNACV